MANKIEQLLREIGTPEEQIEAVKMLLMVVHNNDYNKVCEELNKLKEC